MDQLILYGIWAVMFCGLFFIQMVDSKLRQKDFDKTLNNAIKQNRIDDTNEVLIAEREAIAMLTESLIDVIGIDKAQQIIDKLEL